MLPACGFMDNAAALPTTPQAPQPQQKRSNHMVLNADSSDCYRQSTKCGSAFFRRGRCPLKRRERSSWPAHRRVETLGLLGSVHVRLPWKAHCESSRLSISCDVQLSRIKMVWYEKGLRGKTTRLKTRVLRELVLAAKLYPPAQLAATSSALARRPCLKATPSPLLRC
jgi:hypothetical protein